MSLFFGISRKTGYKIVERYNRVGLEGLTDRSGRPYRQANQLPFQIEQLTVSYVLYFLILHTMKLFVMGERMGSIHFIKNRSFTGALWRGFVSVLWVLIHGYQPKK